MNLNKIDRNNMYKKFYALLKELGISHHKEDLLAGYGVDSLTELTDIELAELTTRLEGMKRLHIDNYTRKLRSQILTILQKLDIYHDNRDWGKVNEYLMDNRIAGKLLYEMSDNELVALRTKLNSVLRKYEATKAANEILIKCN